jgi:hypothetical protein
MYSITSLHIFLQGIMSNYFIIGYGKLEVNPKKSDRRRP